MEPNQTQEKSNGALIGLVVIVIVLVIGGIYIWSNSIKAQPAAQKATSDIQSSTNPAASIDADLNNVDLNSLDSGI